jgi:hypothetical protein
MPRTPTLALLSPPLDSERRPGTARSTSVALAAVAATTPSPSIVLIDTLERILVAPPEVPVTTTLSSFSPSLDLASAVAGASAVCACAALSCSNATAAARAMRVGVGWRFMRVSKVSL